MHLNNKIMEPSIKIFAFISSTEIFSKSITGYQLAPRGLSCFIRQGFFLSEGGGTLLSILINLSRVKWLERYYATERLTHK